MKSAVMAALMMALMFMLGMGAQYLYSRNPMAGQVWKMKESVGTNDIYVIKADADTVTFVQVGYTITMPREYFIQGAEPK